MRHQHGYALIEFMLSSAVILLLGAGLLWLQRWQQVKVQTQHHAALSAFRYSATHLLGEESLHFLPEYIQGLHATVAHQSQRQATTLASLQEWQPLQVAHEGQLLGHTERIRFEVVAAEQTQHKPAWGLRLPFMSTSMQVQAQTSLQVGVGASYGPEPTWQRLQAHERLWQKVASGSQMVVKQLGPLLSPVDAAWSRSAPHTQWLAPWKESIPPRYLY